MSLFNKIKWVAGILLVFAIVLTTNLIDKDNFSRLRNSIETIYEDRIIANDLIFEISILIQEKEIALALSDSTFYEKENQQANEEIGLFLERYEQTKLTKMERELLGTLKSNISDLQQLENDKPILNEESRIARFTIIDAIVHNLYDLSKIQLKEGERELIDSKRTMDTIDLFTRVETIFLIIMAVLVQIIVLYKNRERD